MAVDMSYRLGWIDDSIVKRVLSILQQAKLPTAPPDVMTVEKFKASMAVRDRDIFMFNSCLFFFETQLVHALNQVIWYCRLTRRWLMAC